MFQHLIDLLISSFEEQAHAAGCHVVDVTSMAGYPTCDGLRRAKQAPGSHRQGRLQLCRRETRTPPPAMERGAAKRSTRRNVVDSKRLYYFFAQKSEVLCSVPQNPQFGQKCVVQVAARIYFDYSEWGAPG